MSNLILLGAGVSTFCNDTHEILELVGWVLTIFKIAIPLIIIALGLLDLGKAAISSKPEEIKKSAMSLVWRLVGGIVIFFIPTIVMLVFGFVNDFGENKGNVDFDVCYGCIVSPWGDACKNANSTVAY